MISSIKTDIFSIVGMNESPRKGIFAISATMGKKMRNKQIQGAEEAKARRSYKLRDFYILYYTSIVSWCQQIRLTMDGWMRSWWWLSTYYMWQRTAGSKWCSEAGDLLGKGIYSKFHSNCWDSKSWFPISQLTATWKKKSIGRRRQFFSLDFPRIALWEIKTAIFRWMDRASLNLLFPRHYILTRFCRLFIRQSSFSRDWEIYWDRQYFLSLTFTEWKRGPSGRLVIQVAISIAARDFRNN